MVTSAQCKAARQLLGWDFGQLSRSASLYYHTVISFECCSGQAHSKTRQKLRTAFESAGVEFFHDADGLPQVRLRKAEE